MQYIYIDESGDLGFDFKKKGTSRYFVVAAIITNDKVVLEQVIRKTLKTLSRKDRRHHSGTFHAFKEKDKTIKTILKLLINSQNTKISYLCMKKRNKVVKNDIHILYNELVSKLVRGSVDEDNVNDTVLVSSQRETNKTLNQKFVSFLTKVIGVNSKIKIGNPSDEKGLQLADIVSWAVFKKYESEEGLYYKMIENLIIKRIEF